MNDQQISSKLRAIADGPKKTETARLRDIFDDVEHALMRKTQSEVLSILHEGGFKFTEAGFRYSLAKIRRERGTGRMAKKKGDKQQEPAPIPIPIPSLAVAPPPPVTTVQTPAATGAPPPAAKKAFTTEEIINGDFSKKISAGYKPQKHKIN